MDAQGVLDVTATLVKRYEGLSLAAYVCPAGFWTIGYGHLCAAAQPDISRDTAEALLASDLSKSLIQTLALVPVLANHPDKLAAITDFTFNLGAGRLKASTLRAVINTDQWARVPQELRRWVHGGGKKLPGLVLRRDAEVALWER